MIGRKVVSEDGRFLGKVSDVLIDRTNGHIFGYLLGEHTPGAMFEEIFGKDKQKRREAPYLPADAKIRTGRDLIVASEDAVSYDWGDEDAPAVTGTPMNKWGYTPPPSPIEPTLHVEPAPSNWVRRADEVVPPGTLPNEIDGIETGRESNPRVR